MTAPGIVYFGDSLSDDGNLYAATDGVLPNFIRSALGGDANSASDGIVHSQYTADLTGLSVENYAIGAAQAQGEYLLGDVLDDFGLDSFVTVPDDDASLDFDFNLSAQIDRFEADYSGQDLSNTSAVLLIGANDFGAIDTTSPTVITQAIATLTGTVIGTLTAVFDLVQAGVGTVYISTLPSTSFFPAFYDGDPLEALIGDLVFDAHNDLIESTVEDLNQLGGNVDILDTQTIAYAITEDPSGFGLIAPYADTQLESDVLDDFDPNQIAFWDAVHPTTATHGVFGAYNAHVLQGGEVHAMTDASTRLTLAGTQDNLALAYGGNDILETGDGDDIVFGGSESGSIRGEANDDVLSGGSDDDLVFGGSGADVLDGDEGDDLLRGNMGSDVLIDGLGNDTARGGSGDDTFIYTQASLIGGTDGDDTDQFFGGLGIDTLYLVLDTVMVALADSDLSLALSQLGLTTTNIENFEILETRDALSDLSGEGWYTDADVWGLI